MSDTGQKKRRNNPGLTSRPPGKNPAAPYSPEEMPPNPRSGDAGGDARGQKDIERRREAERERSETNHVKRSPQSN